MRRVARVCPSSGSLPRATVSLRHQLCPCPGTATELVWRLLLWIVVKRRLFCNGQCTMVPHQGEDQDACYCQTNCPMVAVCAKSLDDRWALLALWVENIRSSWP